MDGGGPKLHDAMDRSDTPRHGPPVRAGRDGRGSPREASDTGPAPLRPGRPASLRDGRATRPGGEEGGRAGAGAFHQPLRGPGPRAGLPRLSALSGAGRGPGDPLQDARGAPAQPRRGHGRTGEADGGLRGPRGGAGGPVRVRPGRRHGDDRPPGAAGGPGRVDRGRGRVHARAPRLLGALGAPRRRHLPDELVSRAGPPRRPGLGADPVRPVAPALAPGGGALHGPLRPPRGAGRRLVGPDHAEGRGRAGAPGRDDRGEPGARLRPRLLRTVRGPRAPGRRDDRPGAGLPRARRQPRGHARIRRRGHPALRAVVRALLRRGVRDRPRVLRLERQRMLGAGPARRPGHAAPLGGDALPRPPGHARDLPPVVLERRRHRRIRRDLHGRGPGQLLHRAPAGREIRAECPADRLAARPDLAPDDRPRGPAPGRLLRVAGAGQHRAGDPGPQGDGQPELAVQPGLRPRGEGRGDDPQPARPRSVLRLLPEHLPRLRLQDLPVRRPQARAGRLRSGL